MSRHNLEDYKVRAGCSTLTAWQTYQPGTSHRQTFISKCYGSLTPRTAMMCSTI